MLHKQRVTISSSAARPNPFLLNSTQVVCNFDLLSRGQLLQKSLHLDLDTAIRYQPTVRQWQVGHWGGVVLGQPVCDCITLISVVICCCHRVFKVILRDSTMYNSADSTPHDSRHLLLSCSVRQQSIWLICNSIERQTLLQHMPSKVTISCRIGAEMKRHA